MVGGKSRHNKKTQKKGNDKKKKHLQRKTNACGGGGVGGGGVTQQMFIYTGRYGEAPPQGPNPYPLYTIFLREGTHFAYPLLTNQVTVSHTLIRILHPFPDR